MTPFDVKDLKNVQGRFAPYKVLAIEPQVERATTLTLRLALRNELNDQFRSTSIMVHRRLLHYVRQELTYEMLFELYGNDIRYGVFTLPE